MKKVFITASICFLIVSSGFSQNKVKVKEEEKVVVKERINENNEVKKEVIIIKKGDSNSADDMKIIVNGKEMTKEEFEKSGGNILIEKELSVANANGNKEMKWIIKEDNSKKAFLGVVTEKVKNGVQIKEVVKNSPSVNSLKEGDVIVKINERNIDDENRLVAVIQSYLPGEEITVHYIRNNKSESAKIKLGERSGSEGLKLSEKDFFEKDVRVVMKEHNIPMPMMKNIRPTLGMKIQDVEVGDGAKVLEVSTGSIAEKAGLMKDDLIFEFDGKEVKRTKDLKETYNDTKDKTSVMIKVIRKGLIQSFELKIPKKIETIDL